MKNNNQKKRSFLSLNKGNKADSLRRFLESPLGLVYEVIKFLFEELDELVSFLKTGEKKRNSKVKNLSEVMCKILAPDKIKLFAAGVERAQTLSEDYRLAWFYRPMFLFHQYFHSSYRSRQGNVLEKIIEKALSRYCDQVLHDRKEIDLFAAHIFKLKEKRKLNVDIVGVARNKAIMIELRSRDDTGGGPAKESLVYVLRELIRTGKTPRIKILYLVCIWDPMESEQKSTTINKWYSSLEELIREKIRKDYFKKRLEKGKSIIIKKGIKLKLAYGTEQMLAAFREWGAKKDKRNSNEILKVVNLIKNWDDLWVAYSVASIELQNICISRTSNIKLINGAYNKFKDKLDPNSKSYDELCTSIDRVAKKIAYSRSDFIIPTSMDKVNYIKDLLFLRVCYAKIFDRSKRSTKDKLTT